MLSFSPTLSHSVSLILFLPLPLPFSLCLSLSLYCPRLLSHFLSRLPCFHSLAVSPFIPPFLSLHPSINLSLSPFSLSPAHSLLSLSLSLALPLAFFCLLRESECKQLWYRRRAASGCILELISPISLLLLRHI